MEPIIILEDTFAQQTNLLKQCAPFRKMDIEAICDILARVYGYNNAEELPKHAEAATAKTGSQSQIPEQFALLVNRLSQLANIDGQVAKHIIMMLWPSSISQEQKRWRQHRAVFRFYGPLNDFLRQTHRKMPIEYQFDGLPSIKDSIEAQGIPHTEVALISVDDRAIDCNEKIADDKTYHVYPYNYPAHGKRLPAPRPDTELRFALDVHLAKLARYLRMLGLDCYLMEKDQGDKYLVDLAIRQYRIVLTRDKNLLKFARLGFGYWLRSRDPSEQLREVVRYFQIKSNGREFSRCLECNSQLQNVEKAEILEQLPPLVAREYNDFKQCVNCQKVYWKGSHFDRMRNMLIKNLNVPY